MDDSPHDGHEPFGSELARSGYPHRHRLPAASFEQLCGGPVAEATMALLERSQYSQRKLALRALIQQLEHNPDAVGPLVLPDQAWRILAAAERRDPAAVREILLYPPVGVWLRRALHHTRREQTCGLPWTELGYLQLIAAAAAVSCRVSCVVRVPVWHGVVTLPTVGQVRLPRHSGSSPHRARHPGVGMRWPGIGRSSSGCPGPGVLAGEATGQHGPGADHGGTHRRPRPVPGIRRPAAAD